MGLSIVTMCRVSVSLISWINAARVEDLPEPVAPLTRIKPLWPAISFLKSGCKLSLSTVATKEESSRMAKPMPREGGKKMDLPPRGEEEREQRDGKPDAGGSLQDFDAAAHAVKVSGAVEGLL